jgi:hypothetical protein
VLYQVGVSTSRLLILNVWQRESIHFVICVRMQQIQRCLTDCNKT